MRVAIYVLSLHVGMILAQVVCSIGSNSSFPVYGDDSSRLDADDQRIIFPCMG